MSRRSAPSPAGKAGGPPPPRHGGHRMAGRTSRDSASGGPNEGGQLAGAGGGRRLVDWERVPGLIDRLHAGERLTTPAVAAALEVDVETALVTLSRIARHRRLEVVAGLWGLSTAPEHVPARFPVSEYVPRGGGRLHQGWADWALTGRCWCGPVTGSTWTWHVVHRDPTTGVAPWPPSAAAAAGWELVVEDWPAFADVGEAVAGPGPEREEHELDKLVELDELDKLVEPPADERSPAAAAAAADVDDASAR